MVKTPIMLELNMVPTVASATSSFMIIFTSSSTSLQFLILGKIQVVTWSVSSLC